jgi:hypothetical protein
MKFVRTSKQIKSAFAVVAVVTGALVPGCTEPAASGYFEGTITTIPEPDIFTILRPIKVVRSESDPCQQANVYLVASTFIFQAGRSLKKLDRTALAVGQVVRVGPLPATDACPLSIDATSIAIVR